MKEMVPYFEDQKFRGVFKCHGKEDAKRGCGKWFEVTHQDLYLIEGEIMGGDYVEVAFVCPGCGAETIVDLVFDGFHSEETRYFALRNALPKYSSRHPHVHQEPTVLQILGDATVAIMRKLFHV